MAAQFPHCNSETIHAPGKCYFCDQYPKLQKSREVSGLPFTSLESNGWSGNVAVGYGETHSHMGVTWTVPRKGVLGLLDRLRGV